MIAPSLIDSANALMVSGKGLLAMDESNGTCNARFAAAGLPQTSEARRAYREMLLTASGLSDGISGAILYDETIRQHAADGTTFVKILATSGIMIGIKVDIGAKSLAAHEGETVTEGLDGLRERLKSYFEMGARFAKWRGVITLGSAGSHFPSRGAVQANAHALARYASMCQEAGLVPVVEPEVLMTGDHTMQRCEEATSSVLRQLFRSLAEQRVILEALILKTNMVLPGLECAAQPDPQEVAEATVRCLHRVVPCAVAGVAFLSGGQSGTQASQRLNAMHGPLQLLRGRSLPWPLTFSFSRALQYPALDVWAGEGSTRAAAQSALMHRVRCNQAALCGQYSAATESA